MADWWLDNEQLADTFAQMRRVFDRLEAGDIAGEVAAVRLAAGSFTLFGHPEALLVLAKHAMEEGPPPDISHLLYAAADRLEALRMGVEL